MKPVCCFFLLILFSGSCKNKAPEIKIDTQAMDEKLADANRLLLQKESARIDTFIQRHSWNVSRTGTGLRYEIYEPGLGDNPEVNDEVEINVKVYLLNDKLCYSSDSSGPVKFRMGRGEQLKGLEEGIMLMKQSGKAHLIMPAHLAYGTQGDGAEIPPASSLYINVELIKVNK